MYMCSIDNHSYGNNFTITVKMGNMMHTKTKQNKYNNMYAKREKLHKKVNLKTRVFLTRTT